MNDAINKKEVNILKRSVLDFPQMITGLHLQESCVLTETGGLGREKEKLNNQRMNEYCKQAVEFCGIRKAFRAALNRKTRRGDGELDFPQCK